MGSENSALKSYTLKEPPFTLPSGLAVYPAVLQDGKFASVFVYKRENEDKVNKAAKHLKTLRHPCLLRFLSCTVEVDGIHLVTERVQPLEVALETLSSAEVCAGIYDILLALIFLHDRGHLTHNNVCLSSVFVSEDGHWKLGGMETVCKVSQATPEFLRSIQSIRDPASIPPEEMSPEFTTLPECHGHARDAFSFGTLVESLLTILNEQVSADVLSSFQQTLHSTLLNPIPKCRPALCTLLSHDFFREDVCRLNCTSKLIQCHDQFPGFLLDRVSCLSEELIASRLVPLLLNQLVFAEPVAVKSFLPYLLGPKKDHAQGETPCLLSPALFQSRVIPVLLQLFEVHEEHVRMVLLSHIEAYVEHFTQEQLKKVILPQVRGQVCSGVVTEPEGRYFMRIILFPTGDPFSQPIKFPINGLSDVKNTSEDSENFPSSSKKSEEWPDWSEPEEPENQTVNIQIWPRETCDDVKSQCTTLDVEESSWDDCEPSSLDTKVNPGGGITATKPVTSGEQKPIPALLSLTEESMPWKSSLPQKTSLVQRGDDADQIKPPKVSSQERPLKVPSELGLGEEFTIQVKKKPVKDPEMDWFADMIPEIKPSAAFLILPELRTEMVPKKDDVSPVMQFSSKFAAAEITEGEAEGWEEEGELNWEDNNW
uniref:SCY1 like pseudokinase 3 n=1 Tax=Pan troglodytes TaxID=9598 RepID=A0A2I3RYW7_PANTR